MKLISPFNDYYDSVQKTQFDKEGPLWIRKNSVVDKYEAASALQKIRVKIGKVYHNFTPGEDWEFIDDYSRHWNYYSDGRFVKRNNKLEYFISPFLVCIAGKIIPALNIRLYYDTKVHNKFVYDKIGLSEFESDHNTKTYDSLRLKSYIDWWFTKNSEPDAIIWRELETPLFVVWLKKDKTKTLNFEIEKNPILKDLDFAKKMDPFTLWQEVDMFMRNQLVTEVDYGTVDEASRYDQHGFDKWSFRKLPEK